MFQEALHKYEALQDRLQTMDPVERYSAICLFVLTFSSLFKISITSVLWCSPRGSRAGSPRGRGSGSESDMERVRTLSEQVSLYNFVQFVHGLQFSIEWFQVHQLEQEKRQWQQQQQTAALQTIDARRLTEDARQVGGHGYVVGGNRECI